MEKITVNVPFEITQEFVEDVMCTALEGGSNYWIDSIEPLEVIPEAKRLSQYLTRGGTLVIVADGEEYVTYKITLQDFVNGYKMYVNNCINNNRTVYTDPSDIDVEIADYILQCAVFEDVVYG